MTAILSVALAFSMIVNFVLFGELDRRNGGDRP